MLQNPAYKSHTLSRLLSFEHVHTHTEGCQPFIVQNPLFLSDRSSHTHHTQTHTALLPSALASLSCGISLASVLYWSWQVSQSEAVQCGHLPDVFPNRPLLQREEATLPYHGVLHSSRSSPHVMNHFTLLQRQVKKKKKETPGSCGVRCTQWTAVSTHYLMLDED